jgi:transcriptional regulator
MLSVRAYDSDGSMVDADVVDGVAVETLLARLFDRADTSYVHVHFARRGCYACRVERA